MADASPAARRDIDHQLLTIPLNELRQDGGGRERGCAAGLPDVQAALPEAALPEVQGGEEERFVRLLEGF